MRSRISRCRFPLCLLLLCGTLLSLSRTAIALNIDLERPGESEFVRDLANMIDAKDEKHITELCDKLLSEKKTPIIVVTIESMAKYGGSSSMKIETFATLLFNQWEIGHAKLGKKDWNTGFLLLISKDDRVVKIELGAGWGRSKNAECKEIMDNFIIPKFKQGQFSAGILAGTESLDKIARGLELPKIPRPWWHYALVVGFFGAMIFTIVSLIRRGASGWAWLFWAAAFSIMGFLLYNLLSNRSSGGGFSGGSFGGGFSGGGGASGSW